MDNNAQHVKQPVIMQVIPELGAGGAEQGCIDIAAELVRAGSRAIVVSHGGARIPELLRHKALHIDLPVHSKNPLTILRNAKRLRKIIREHDVDIVHARSRVPAWSAYKACKGTDAKFMTTCHAPYNIGNGAKRRYNAIMARGERVIAISQYVSDYLRDNYDVNPRNLRLIHRGVAIERFHPTAVTPERLIAISNEWRVPEGSHVIMLPGRLTRWKGHLVLLEALAKLRRSDIFCIFVGSDQGRTGYRQEVEQNIEAKNLTGQVRIVEHCNDMPAAYMIANVVVSASTDPEGFGRIPIEAQAMGRPIIATDHGGARETILNGETGWLVMPGDAMALAEALNEALNLDPRRRSIMATRGMSHIANHFTKEKMCDDTLNVYAELLQEKYAHGFSDMHKAAE